jgi:hypothetical protein
MKNGDFILGVVVGLGIAVVYHSVVSALGARVSYSGPGVHGNLVQLEVAKARWAEAHTNSDWPTMQDIAPYFTNGTTLWLGPVRPVRREVYIVNKVGTPVISYDPGTDATTFVSSNDYLGILREDKE